MDRAVYRRERRGLRVDIVHIRTRSSTDVCAGSHASRVGLVVIMLCVGMSAMRTPLRSKTPDGCSYTPWETPRVALWPNAWALHAPPRMTGFDTRLPARRTRRVRQRVRTWKVLSCGMFCHPPKPGLDDESRGAWPRATQGLGPRWSGCGN